MNLFDLTEDLDGAPLFYDVLSRDGRLLAANRTEATAFGYRAQDLRPKPASLIYGNASLGADQSAFWSPSSSKPAAGAPDHQDP